MARTPSRSLSRSAARAIGNRLLTLLPAEDREALVKYLEPYPVKRGETLLQPNVAIHHVYFVSEGLVSLVQLLENGKYIEAGIVGREGTVGALVPLGAVAFSHEAVVQIPGMSLRMKADALRIEVAMRPALRELLLRYVQALFSQVTQSVVCNGQHAVHRRLARWLAMAADCVESDELPLTHDLLATMLGVRRSGITEDLAVLKRAGLIATRKGGLRIVDQRRIRAEACECYGTVRSEFRRLLGSSIFQETGTSTTT